MFKSVKKAKSNPKDNKEQAALNPRPLWERVTRTCRVRGNKKQTGSITSRQLSSALNVILERERSELSRGSRNIKSLFSNGADSITSRFLNVIAGRIPAIFVQRVTNLVNKFALLLNGANSTASRLSSFSLNVILERERSELSRGSRNIMAILFNEANSVFSRFLNVIAGRVPVILVQRVTNLVNKFALLLHKYRFSQDSRDRLCVTPENDGVKMGKVLKSALIITAFMLFSAAAQATVCFLPDGNCGDVNYGYKSDSSPNCTYRTSDEANLKKGECEEVKKQGFCYYLSCSMSKSECDKSAAEVNKCCVPCGNCWQVDDCVNPPIPTCKGSGYETEKTCKDKNQNFEPNGKFDKSGTACGTCKDVPYITCPEMGDDYVTRAQCTAKGSGFTFNYADVKDSDSNECGTCDEEEPETCSYEYRHATVSDTCGSSNVIGTDGCKYYNLSILSSVYLYSTSTNSVNGLVNKIDNTSKTCVDEKSVTKYEKVCDGIPESYANCPTGESFIPNGCVSDSYVIKYSNNTFEVAGDRFGSCSVDAQCPYKYKHLTMNDTKGVSSLVSNSDLFTKIQSKQGNAASVGLSYNGKEWSPTNLISKDSRTCVTSSGETAYETLCPSAGNCGTGEKVTATCSSESYNVGALTVNSITSVICSCDADNGYYADEQTCKTATNQNCNKLYSEHCYQSCSKLGLYGTESSCPKYKTVSNGSTYGSVKIEGNCRASGNCYQFYTYNFYIHKTQNNDTISCCDQHHNCITASISAYLLTTGNNKTYAKDINGKDGDISTSGTQYSTYQRSYYLCGRIGVDSLPTHASFTLNGSVFADKNSNMNNSDMYQDNSNAGTAICKLISFNPGEAYSVGWTIGSGGMQNGVNYTCTLR